MLSRWCGLFFFFCYLIQTVRRKRYNKRKYQRGWEDWSLKKVSIYTDISGTSPSRYEKDIVIHGRITNSKNANKIVLSYHIIMCHFLATDGNVLFPN